MGDSPVAFSAALPLWLKLTVGAALVLLGALLISSAVRRGSIRATDLERRMYSPRDIRIPASLAGLLVLGVAAVGLDVAYDGWLTRTFDVPVLEFFVDARSPGLTAVVVTITNLASPFGSTVLAIIAATLAAWRTRSWVPPLLIVIGPSLAGLAVRLVKLVAPRARPAGLTQAVLTVEPSFPSGHVTGAVALYGCIVVVVLTGLLGPVTAAVRALTVTAALVAGTIVMATRLYLGVHWFTDVTAGALLGLEGLAGTVAVHRQVTRVRTAARHSVSRSPQPSPER